MQSLADLGAEHPRASHHLRNALSHGREHHAYILAGPVRAHNETLALALAQGLSCLSPHTGSGCGDCSGCRQIAGGNHPDVIQVRPKIETGKKKRIISIDAIRTTTASLGLRAVEAGRKVALILEAEMMPREAQNALLKTLEEPPGPTVFILTTTRPRSLLPTVRSRCQRVTLEPPKLDAAAAELATVEGAENISRQLAALLGPDPDRAEAMVGDGAVEVVELLDSALQPKVDANTVVRIAGELGSDKERAKVALALLEVMLRDALAGHYGAPGSAMIGQGRTLPADRLAATVDRLQEVKQREAFNLNPTMSLEGLLLQAAGLLPA